MALAKKETIVVGEVQEEVTLVSPALAKKVEEIKEEITIVQPIEEKASIVKMVKVKAKNDHRCFIGGEWYYLIKDKQYNVPENVKTILMSADILSPL